MVKAITFWWKIQKANGYYRGQWHVLTDFNMTPYIIEGLNDNEQGWETLHGCRVEYELLTALYEMTAAKEIPLWAVL